LTSDILKLGATFLKMYDYPIPLRAVVPIQVIGEPYIGYTFEFIEQEEEKEREKRSK